MKATRSLVIVLCIVMGSAAVDAYAAPPSAFTYQGQLKHQGVPVNGEARFAFTLWDAEQDGHQIAPAVETRTAIANGLFTEELDFGLEPFRGEPLWLEITVVTEAGEARLSPRQLITASPVALFALSGNEGPPGPPGDGMTLPYAGTVESNEATAFGVVQTGMYGAAAFGIDNADNTQPALSLVTAGSGPGLLSITASGPAIWGRTGVGGGNAGYFETLGTDNTQPALGAENKASGPAAHFRTTKLENTNPTLVVEAFSDGPAATFTTHDNPNNSNLDTTVEVENQSFGSAGQFALSNSQSTADALKVNTIAGGSAINAYTNGSGRAGLFEVDNIGIRTVPAVEVTTNSRGGGAGLFKTTNGLNTTTALIVEASGSAGAIIGTAKGSGPAITGHNTGGGDAIVGIVDNDAGKAGAFKNLEATNDQPTVEVLTNGTGPAGYFETTQLAGQPIALHAKTNAVSGWAGYFEGKAYFSDPVGINVESPGAQLEIAPGPIPAGPLLKVGEVMDVLGTGVVEVNGTLIVDRIRFSEPQTRYYSVSYADFSPQSVTTQKDDAGYYCAPGSASGPPDISNDSCNGYGLRAPVHLPHEATVEKITVYMADWDGDINMSVRLLRYHLVNNTELALASVTSSGSSGRQSATFTVPGGVLVDNSTSIYYLTAWGDKERDALNCDGWGGVNISAVIIEYTVQELP